MLSLPIVAFPLPGRDRLEAMPLLSVDRRIM
jgi:hypothetical protein